MKRLSVIIANYNVSAFLRQAIESVIRASEETDTEIIVVDNNSSDDSVLMVRRSFPGVMLITSEVNEGFGAACNKGIKASSGEYVLILNPDTVVSADALSVCISFMDTHPDAGALGARMTDGEGRFLPESKRGFPSPATSFYRLTGLGHLFRRSARFNAYYLGHCSDKEICRADILTGAFMFIRREALDRAGLFDTSFFMYGEDIDLSWRIVRCGFVNYYFPPAAITHFKGRSAPTTDPARIRHFHEAMVIFARKYFDRRWRWLIIASIYAKMHLSLSLALVRRLTGKTA